MMVSRPRLPAGILLLGLFASGCDGAGAGVQSPGGNHPLTGKAAPAFALRAQSGGKHVSLEDARGKVALVDFWATWCGPCKASFPKYQALAQKYSDDLVVIGVSEDDEADGIQEFARDTGATFPLAWDGDKGVAKEYRPGSMPTSFIIDKEGVVRFVHSGFREGEDKTIETQVKSLMN
jgi:cytochrome c biogenesis protein CcmG, thiol:disulfide interchange protein DsbE